MLKCVRWVGTGAHGSGGGVGGRQRCGPPIRYGGTNAFVENINKIYKLLMSDSLRIIIKDEVFPLDKLINPI